MKHITKNFFLQGDGTCLKHNILLLKSEHLYPQFLIKQYLRAIKEYYIARYARSGKYKKLDSNEIYLVAYHNWFNYYHWMVESIPRILKYKEFHSELTLLMIKPQYDVSFVQESLKPFSFKEIIVNDIWNYHVPKGIISPIQAYCYRYEVPVIKEVRALYHTFFIKNDLVEPFRKVYVTRRNAIQRKVENENEVIDLMKSNGFEIIELENSSLEYQVKLFSETKVFVSIHGAALTNMLFMKKGTKVIELYRKASSIFAHKSKVYSNLSIALDLNYHAIECNPINQNDSFFYGNLVVPIEDIRLLIEMGIEKQSKIISVKNRLPINLESNHKYLFNNREQYSFSPTKVKKLKNVFVTHWGILLHRYVIPFKSAENLVGFYDKTIYFKNLRLAFEQYLVCRFGKSLKCDTFDSKEYFTIHTTWFGYFSWFTSNLPRLIKAHETNKNAILLLPEKIELLPYVSETLGFFTDLQIKTIEDTHHVFIKNYLFSESRSWTSQFDINDLQIVRFMCFSYLEKQQKSNIDMPLLYISRKKAKRRNIINETEIEQYLNSKRFKCICFEDFSVIEQISLMQQAKVVISLHGAGLTNVLFMNPLTAVLELSPSPDKKSQFRFPFWRICDLLNIDYYIQFCKTIDKGEIDIYSRNVTVDMDIFIKNVMMILSNVNNE